MTGPGARTVLIDLTCLRTGSRARGIGRYAASLARAFACLPAAALHSMRISYLTDIARDGAATVTADPHLALQWLSDPARRGWTQLERETRLRLGYRRLVEELRPDLVHFPQPRGVPPPVNGVRTLLTCHDLIPFLFPTQYLAGRRRAQRLWFGTVRRYTFAHHILCISQATADDLTRLIATTRTKVSIVYHGVGAEVQSEETDLGAAVLLRRFGIDRRFFLSVGNADYRKNADGILAALGKLRGDIPLVWVGRLSPDRRRAVEALAREHGVSVACPGYVCDGVLGSLYRRALATVYVSRYEGFGYPLLEAMQNGCPVITSNVSSLPEIAGEAGLLVDPENTDEIASSMQRLRDDASLRRRLRAAGHRRVREFSLARQIEDTIGVYRKILQ